MVKQHMHALQNKTKQQQKKKKKKKHKIQLLETQIK